MSKTKAWQDLSPLGRAKRMGVGRQVIDNALSVHLPDADKAPVIPQTVRHSKCRERGACTGPGCVVGNGAVRLR